MSADSKILNFIYVKLLKNVPIEDQLIMVETDGLLAVSPLEKALDFLL